MKKTEDEKTNECESCSPFHPRIGPHLIDWSPGQAQTAVPVKGKLLECCRVMNEQIHKMMEEIKAQEDEFVAQVAEVNSAPEDEKSGMIAADITRIMEQRTAMDMRIKTMQEKMIKHMMQHLRMDRESIEKCPAMNYMEEDGWKTKGGLNATKMPAERDADEPRRNLHAGKA